MKHCSDLISASPILHLTHSTPKEFEQPVSVTISCPPNPFKTSAVTSTKADEKQDRTDKPTMPPSREDGVIIRLVYSSFKETIVSPDKALGVPTIYIPWVQISVSKKTKPFEQGSSKKDVRWRKQFGGSVWEWTTFPKFVQW